MEKYLGGGQFKKYSVKEGLQGNQGIILARITPDPSSLEAYVTGVEDFRSHLAGVMSVSPRRTILAAYSGISAALAVELTRDIVYLSSSEPEQCTKLKNPETIAQDIEALLEAAK